MAQAFFQEDEILGKAYDARLVRRLWAFVHPYRYTFLFTLAAHPACLGRRPARAIHHAGCHRPLHRADPEHRLSPTDRANGVFVMALIYMLVLVAGFGLRYYQNFLLSVVGQRIMYDMRSKMFEHLQNLSLSFFDHNPVGRLMTRITNDVDALNDLFTSGAISLIGDVFSLVGIVIILLFENWLLALVVFVVIPPLLAGDGVLPAGHARQLPRDSGAAGAHQRQHRREYLRHADCAALQPREAQLRSTSTRSTWTIAAHPCGRSSTSRSSFPSSASLPSVATALIIRVGGGQVLASALTLGALVAFLQYVDRFFLPLRDMADKYTVLQSAMASSERIFRVLDEPVTVQDPEQAAAARSCARRGGVPRCLVRL